MKTPYARKELDETPRPMGATVVKYDDVRMTGLYRVVLYIPGVGTFHRKPSGSQASAQAIADVWNVGAKGNTGLIGMFLGNEWTKVAT